MGFRCMLCKKDFGINKKDFIKHTKTNHLGLMNDVMQTMSHILNIEINENIEKKKK